MKLRTLLMEAAKITAVGIHFSHSPNLTRLDASRWGTGISGMEKHRFINYKEHFVKDRIYFYIKGNTKWRKEVGLGAYEYEATLTGLYDFQRDPDRLYDKARQEAKRIHDSEMANSKYNIANPVPADLVMTLYEKEIKKAGYSGYINNEMGAIVYFRDVAVTPVQVAA